MLLYCARPSIDDKVKAKITSLLDKVDWDYLIQIASRHGLMPLLYYKVNKIYPEGVPEDIKVELEDNFKVNLRGNLLLTGELKNILKLLKSENINSIPYKGPVLAYLAYDNLALRDFGDIDFLVDKSELLKAKSLLIYNGYELYPALEIKDSYYMKLEPEYQFISKNTGALIEIKWKIQGNFFSLPELDFLSEELEEYNINDFKVKTFSPENLILILSIHAAKHDWERLSWILDLAELCKSHNINWLEVLEKGEKLGIKKIILTNLLLTENLFDLELPLNVTEEINSDPYIHKNCQRIMKIIFLKGGSLNLFEKFFYDLRKRDNLILGVKDSVNGLIKPTYLDFTDFSLPERLFFLYYLIRPFLLLKRWKELHINPNIAYHSLKYKSKLQKVL